MSQLEAIQENLRRGLTELLIMCLLTEEDKYGYQLLTDLKKRTDGLFDLTTASLYGPLYRLQSKRYIVEREVTSGSRRKRTYYHLTEAGYAYYKLVLKEYYRTHIQVSKIVGLDIYGEQRESIN